MTAEAAREEIALARVEPRPARSRAATASKALPRRGN